ncbi:MAG: SpoIIIAH-like family protein [Ruminococcaceae bacterium]|nr:SpoIIIAH-like family protein [Oscillospiraceae bacterium]
MLKLKKPNTALIVAKTKEAVKKIGRRNLAIILSVLVIGGAVWVNVALFTAGTKEAGGSAGNIVVDGNGSGNVNEVDSFFASTQIERQRSRDEAIEVLQLVVENPEALDESKVVAMQEISKIASAIENEGKIESLVTAKGFEKCIAVISDSGCNVIVKTSSALMPNQVAQIQEIVYEQAGILPSNTKIIEKIA